MIVSRKHLTFFILGIALVLALAIFCAPSLLLVSEAPVKSDAVVLFLGGEKGTREKEAYQLVREGYAEYLIVPARGQVQKPGPNGKLIKIDIDLKLNHLKLNTRRRRSLTLRASGYLTLDQLTLVTRASARLTENWLLLKT